MNLIISGIIIFVALFLLIYLIIGGYWLSEKYGKGEEYKWAVGTILFIVGFAILVSDGDHYCPPRLCP